MQLKIKEKSDIATKFEFIVPSVGFFTVFYMLFTLLTPVLLIYFSLDEDYTVGNIFHLAASGFVFLALQFIYFHFRGRMLVKEKVVAIKEFGLQHEKKYLNGTKDVKFYPLSVIKDIVIHEVLSTYDVGYRLFLIIAGAKQLTILFESFNPKLEILLKVFYPMRNLLSIEKIKN
eukprot:TRINITY_DN4047_c0_g1_i1.p1 TRINITY_DN4047_c0_g1~~TRINITY_DN4047_c0_g1_i1.p1  ORF type:complete len:174 (-),score=11.51 TRINITY_DN4047_c0_g1_i1:82-603(-)